MNIELPRTFQGNCWNPNCPDSIMFDFRVEVVPGGLKCKRCGHLNAYKWTEAEFLDMQKAYGQTPLTKHDLQKIEAAKAKRLRKSTP